MVSLVLAGAAVAVTPGMPGGQSPFGVSTPVFDQWSVTNGTISASGCDTPNTGFECGAALKDDGFYTRLITNNSTGEMFFQTIVTETDATGTQGSLDQDLFFSDENFVSGGNSSGILDKQRLTENQDYVIYNTTAGIVRFENFTEIGTGWAGDYLKLTQTIREELVTTTTFNDFQTDFIFHQDGYSTDVGKGVAMKITQYVPVANINSALPSYPGVNDSQDFVLVDLQGSYVEAAGSVYVESKGFDEQNQLGGGTVSWAANDRIYATWVGQDASGYAGQQFGFVAYDNFSTPENDRIQSFSLADSWHKDKNDDTGGNANYIPGWDSSFWGNLATSGPQGGWGDNNISLVPPLTKPHPLDP